MRKLLILLTPLLILALCLSAIGCGDDDEEEPTPTTATGYTGGEHTFKVSHGSPTSAIVNVMFEKMDELLQQYTDGQVKLEIFPASSLYPTDAEYQAVTTGGIDMIAGADGTFSKEGLLDWMIAYMPCFYGAEGEDSRGHDRRVTEHPDAGGYLLAQLEPRGLKGFAIMPNLHMLLRINNKKEVFAYSDMQGWKINSSVGIANLMVETIGGVGVDISGQELLVAYEQGIIDCVTMSPDGIYAYGLGETNKYGLIYWAVVSHMVPTMNLDVWNSLSPELQDIFTNKVIPEVVDWAWEYVPQAEWDAIDKLREENGMIIHEQPAEERLRFQEELIAKDDTLYYLGMINPDFLRLVDALRTEPYDVAPHFD